MHARLHRIVHGIDEIPRQPFASPSADGPVDPREELFSVVRRVFNLFPAALKRLFPAVRFHSLRERRVLLPSSDDRIDEVLFSSATLVPRRVQPRALRRGPQLVEFHGTNVLDGDVEEPGDVGAPIPLEQVIGGDSSHAR